MYTISPTQSKAARTYLEWSQEDLAKAADLSLSTIRSFENGFGLRLNSIVQIRKTLENAGVEFIEDEGVKRADNEIKIYKGTDSFDKLHNDVVQTLEVYGGDIRCVIKSQDVLKQWLGIINRKYRQQARLFGSIDTKCLITDSMEFSLIPFQCRVLTAQNIEPTSYFVYGNKYAHILQEGRTSFSIVIFNIPLVAHSYRTHFFQLWENAVPLTALNCVEIIV